MNKKISLPLLLLTLFILFLPVNIYAETNNLKPPSIYGDAAITIDVQTGEIIYAKDIDAENYKKQNNVKGMYPASITKLMTALIFSEYQSKNNLEQLYYTYSASLQPRYSLRTEYPVLNLKVGDKISSKDVLNSLLIFSANDMAYTIAGNIGKTSSYDENSDMAVQNFINMMNKKAEDLNMKNTHFVTANGLHDKNHYTTPYDLTLLGRAVLKDKLVSDTLKIQKTSVVINGKTIYLENRNKLVGKDINGAICIGGKTGFTTPAGRCLLAIFDKDGRKIIGVVLHSVYDAKDSYVFEDMKKIIDYSYNVSKTIYKAKDSIVKEVTLSYKPLGFIGPTKEITVPLILKEDVKYYDNYVNNKEISYSIDTEDLNINNIKSSKPIGVLKVFQRENEASYNLYTNITKSQIFKQNLPIYSLFIIILIIILFLIISVIYIIKNKHNRRKHRRYYH